MKRTIAFLKFKKPIQEDIVLETKHPIETDANGFVNVSFYKPNKDKDRQEWKKVELSKFNETFEIVSILTI